MITSLGDAWATRNGCTPVNQDHWILIKLLSFVSDKDGDVSDGRKYFYYQCH